MIASLAFFYAHSICTYNDSKASHGDYPALSTLFLGQTNQVRICIVVAWGKL